MVTRATGAVLVGGASRRMGADKARIEVGGRTLLQRTIATLRELCDEVLVVTSSGGGVEGFGDGKVRVVRDRIDGAGPLAGLEAALAAARHELVVTVAVDMPDLCAAVLRRQLELAASDERLDAVVVLGAAGPEPLHAVYRRRIRHRATALLEAGERRLGRVLDGLVLGQLGTAELAALDPTGRSTGNANTPAELAALAEGRLQA